MQLIPTFALLLLLRAGSTFSATTTNYPNSSLEATNVSPSSTYYSEDDILRRNNEIESRLANASIHGLRKMSPDEGEKFFLDYWSFGPESQIQHNDTSNVEDDLPLDLFTLRSYPFRPSFPFEANHGGLLGSRDFKCPTGTFACTSIERSDRCCSTGDKCEKVQDTGSGDVGCCPLGVTCTNLIGACPGNQTLCSEALGGGCCIPGYECVVGGCAFVSVVTVTIHSTVTLSTKTYSTVPQSSFSSSSSTSNTATTSTDNLVPPARPTGISTSTQKTTSRASVCPTGFYACSAVYQGGCCQTGRDCDTTSCPTTRSTTFTSDGVTIVEPVTTGSSNSGNTGKCATGWFSCADTVGGGCCPSGYTCGSSCTAAASKTTVAKEQATASGGICKLKVPFGCLLGLLGISMLEWLYLPIMSDKPQKPLPFVYQFAAGAVAGVSELQSGVPVAGVDNYNGMLDCFRKIIKNEGAKTLYRGISAPILMEAPKRATKFAANDSWGAFYRDLFKVEKQTQSLAVLTGATAGATESFVVVPFELVKIRLQDKASAGKYNGMLDVVKKIVKTEGPLAMYNGLESTLWRHILWNAGYFGCIFQVRAQLPTPEPGNKSQQTRNDLIAGSIGGIAGTILNTPMDVVKSRIQNTTKVAGQTPKYNWAWPALGTVMKEEGFSALYKGFTPKVLRLGPGGGILLVVFTNVMDFFRKIHEE
ncbi:hypothetical protein N7454_003495 [Penicillium verhagenii]|nr:hypothetical protein N7454_003495 [Penicillium verhagenii]